MKLLFSIVCSLCFVYTSVAQVGATSFSIQYVVSSPYDYIRLYPINELGNPSPQAGVVYTWDIIADGDTAIQTGSFIDYYIQDKKNYQICMHAYVHNDSSIAIRTCKVYYADASFHRQNTQSTPHVFYDDINENCQFDSGEKLLRVPAKYSGKNSVYFNHWYDAFSDTVEMQLLKDTYSIELNHPDVEMSCNNYHLYADSTSGLQLQYIPVRLNKNSYNMGVYGEQADGWNPGYTGTFTLFVKNNGVYSTNPTVELHFPDSLVFLNASIPPDQSVAGKLSWSLVQQAQHTTAIHIRFRISHHAFTNKDTVPITCLMEPAQDETDTLDNRLHLRIPVNGSFDPNDKTVFGVHPMNTSFPIEYRIRFQNTGNAPARRVIIRDTLPEQVDAGSIKILSSSHAMQMKLEGNQAEFLFHDIMLPDSSSDLEGSQGYVRFSVFLGKKGNAQTTYDSVVNRASIYFDFNEPVQTGEAILYAAIGQWLSVKNVNNAPVYSVLPNPGSGSVEIRCHAQSAPIEVGLYNFNGVLVAKSVIESGAESHRMAIPDSLPAGLYILRFGDGPSIKWMLLR